MTSENEMLPLPKGSCASGMCCDAEVYTANQMHAYARANMEPLLEEVEGWERVAAAHAELHGEAEARAERLAEALREARARAADLAAWLKSGNDVPADLPFVFRERWQKIANDIRALEAALTQEGE